MGAEIAIRFFRRGTEVLLVQCDCPSSNQRRPVSVPLDDRSDSAVAERLRLTLDPEMSATLVRRGDPIAAEDDTTQRTVHPFLFECDSRELTLSESITDHEWVQPPLMLDRDTDPWMWDAYLAVAPSVRTVREDVEHGATYVSLRALEVLRDRAAVAAASGDGYESLTELARELRRARGSMGVIETRINRVMATADRTPVSVRERAIKACADAVRADQTAAELVAPRLGDRILTLSRSETVYTALLAASPQSVFVAESRPAQEGIDTAERLAENGLDVTVLVDAAIEGLVAAGNIDTVLIGADSVFADGSVTNKVGSRTAMRAGNDADLDCVVLCSIDKVVPDISVDPEYGPVEAVYDGTAALTVYNPTFERVPAADVTEIATERGTHSPDDLDSIAEKHASYRDWDENRR